MGSKLICHYCKKKFDKNDLVYVTKTRRSCRSCIDGREKEARDYKNLIDYICKGFGQSAPTGKQLKNIAEFKKLGYTYENIQWTIYFITNVIGKRMLNSNLGLVPYYYVQAVEHKELIEQSKKLNKDIKPVKLVTVTRNHKAKDTRRKSSRLVDIEDL